jgi:hypothetical protein
MKELVYSVKVAFWMPQTASETVIGSCNEQLAQFTTERQSALWLEVAFLKRDLSTDSFKLKVISRI